MYNHQSAPQADTELGTMLSGAGRGSDTDNPPHYTMNPDHHDKGNSQDPVPDEPDKREVLGKLKTTARNTPPHPLMKPLEGIDNYGFVGEGAAGGPAMAGRAPPLGGPHVGSYPQPVIKTALPTFTESFYFDYTDAPQSQDFQNVKPNNVVTVKECPPPLILSSEGALLDKALKIVNKALGVLFDIITFPFTCIILFLHYLIRLILHGVLRPLIVDSMMLVIEYIIHPITSGIVLPLWAAAHLILEKVTDTNMVVIRPVVAILRAIRLTDINCTRRSRVETV